MVLEEPVLTSHSAMDGEAAQATSGGARSPASMTIRIFVIFLSVTATLADHDVEHSNERTNKDGFGSMSSMAQSLGLPANAASLGQSMGLPGFLVQTVDRVSAAPPQCVAESGQEGVCVLAKQCLKDGGISLGRCTDGKMICCHRPEEETTVKCGGVVNDNEVVFRSPDYPHQQAVFGQCQVTVHAREEVCQLRLDFSEFSLSPPETCGPRAGYCLDDAFSVSAGVESSSYPVLCGFNSGQHMYVDVSQTKQAVLSVRLSARTEMERRWSIRITQVACWSPTMAPEGCLQYHTKAADTITSFNFARNPTGFHYLANMHYSICIRRQLGFCSILFEENGANGFRLSPLVNQRCRDAYVLIPTGSTGSVTEGNLGDRICGTTFTPVAANLAPFRVSFVTGPRIGYTDCPCPGRRPSGPPSRRPNVPVQQPTLPPLPVPAPVPVVPAPVPVVPAPVPVVPVPVPVVPVPVPVVPAPVPAPLPVQPTGTNPPAATVPLPVTPIGSQQPGNLGAPLLNNTQFAGRQFADALVCRAGGFSLRYAQLPHGC